MQVEQGPWAAPAPRQAPPLWYRLLLGRDPRRTLFRAVLLAALAFLTLRYVVTPVRVQGISMWPTCRDGQWAWVFRLAYVFSEPRRGDIVAVRFTAGEHVMLLKRVVGLPGERVAFHGGQLHVNGRPLDEPYVQSPCDWEEPERSLGPDEYYVVGDNRAMPREDHVHGIAERWRIVGRLIR